ncbi:MAG: SRPBCC domain-containing protein [Sphingobium sp.]
MLEWRPGGRSLIVMHGPDGETVPNEGVVLAFEPNRRFVFTDALTADWHPAGPFMVGVFEVAADGDGALFRATAHHWTAEALARHRDMGFNAGWGAMADQLKAVVEGR